jgi:hypothetical protein
MDVTVRLLVGKVRGHGKQKETSPFRGASRRKRKSKQSLQKNQRPHQRKKRPLRIEGSGLHNVTSTISGRRWMNLASTLQK